MIFMTTLKKYSLDLTVKSVQRVHERYVLIRLTDSKPLPPMRPGQFVEVRVDGSPSTFLRRPISINFVDYEQNELWLLVATVGDGTRRLAQLNVGEKLNCVLPLGNGFSLPQPLRRRGVGCTQVSREALPSLGEGAGMGSLLIGGGVGVAPLLYLGKTLHDMGTEPTFLLGARTAGDLLLLDEFEKYGRVFVTTEDGSMGERGFVTQHTILAGATGATGAAEATETAETAGAFDLIQTCGPTPMMKAVARYAREKGIECEASLENLMACGLGACLCCVEKIASSNPSEGGGTIPPSPNPSALDLGSLATEGTQEGGETILPSPDPSHGGENYTNVCVCKEGPVFNVKRLLW